MDHIHVEIISQQLAIQYSSVKSTINLLQEGATIPFLARYRKEVTGNLDEVQIAEIQKKIKKLNELEARKISILASIEEQGKLTAELKTRILSSYNPDQIEDLYLPFKRKKKTKAEIARESGLEPLAKQIMSQRGQNIDNIAERYLTEKVKTLKEALQGAQDIIAQWVSEDQDVREKLRQLFRRFGLITSKVIPKKEVTAEKYQDYFEFQESLSKCPSHRYLAIMRGENEEMLKIHITIEEGLALQILDRKFIRSDGQESELIADAIADSYTRLIYPSIETQIKNEFKEKADDEAIVVFSNNLRQLLLAPPLGQKPVLAIDPGYRTGCKVVCLDSFGDLLEYTNIFPHPPQKNLEEAKNIIRNLIYKYKIKSIAVGNGTAGRETIAMIQEIDFGELIAIYMVNENGASIYSASEIARKEFPDKDITVRGAVSIGRRLMDPLAELVKIDAKSIGVGQYQHDVNQGKLKENLDSTVSFCVNSVGVNLNTASSHLLTHISGLGPILANNIVEYRRANGDFNAIEELKTVQRFGNKAYEQSAGFLRIRHAKNPLDNTGVHPESYPIVKKMAENAGLSLTDFIKNKDIRKNIILTDYITNTVGMPTLLDIIKELDKPGLDPRGEAKTFNFDDRIQSINDLYEGIVVAGIVTNLTNFGAFIDIGVKQDGLLHISQITDKFIQNPAEVLQITQELSVKVIGLDIARKRINLSLLF